MPNSIPFVNLKLAHAELQTELEAAALRVLRSGWYILGPQVSAFEEEFAAWLGLPAGSAVGVASGTDALLLAFAPATWRPATRSSYPATPLWRPLQPSSSPARGRSSPTSGPTPSLSIPTA